MLKIIFLFCAILFSYININAKNINTSEVEYVKICVDPYWMPMESINENGEHIGIISDILRLIEQKTNLIFTLVPTKTWDESLEFIKEEKCDVVPMITYDESRDYLLFTHIYLDYPEALITRENEDKKTLEEIIKLPIGMTKGYGGIDWLKNKFPDIKIVEVDGIEDAITKIRDKEIYGFSDTLPILGYYLKEKGILDLKISHTFDKIEYTLKGRMGVRKDKIKLYNKLNHALDDLEQNELDEIVKKWAGIDIGDIVVNHTITITILITIFLFALLAFYMNYRLNLLVLVKTKELKESANTLEDKVKEKTKEVRYLLDNVGQGFLTINKDLLIDDGYSKECENLLGKDIINKHIGNLLFSKASESRSFESNIDMILKMSENTRALAIPLLAKEAKAKEKIISIEYKLVGDKFILILTDITMQKKLESKIKDEQNILKMIVGIIKDNDIFYDLKNDFNYFVKNIDDSIDKNESASNNNKNIYNKIHTFKGLFLQLFMNTTSSHLHDIESELYDMLHNKNTTNESLLKFLKEANFQTFIKSDLNHISNILGKDFITRDKFISIDRTSLKNIEEKCVSLAETYNENELIIDMLDNIRALSIKSLKSYLDSYANLIFRVSQKLNKPIYNFRSVGDEKILVPIKCIRFIESLNHVFRNAITHGIEAKNDRHKLNKDIIGELSCSFSKENNNLKIIISDDGQGIDVEKIKEKVGNSELSREEAYLCIFKDSFSTKDEIDQFSGRGAGLSSVKAEVDKLDGNIELISDINIGTKFIFTISL